MSSHLDRAIKSSNGNKDNKEEKKSFHNLDNKGNKPKGNK